MGVRSTVCLACAGLLLSIENMAAEQTRLLVDAAQYECVLEHKAEYLAAAKDPMMLFLTLCPNVNPTTAEKARLAQNYYPGPPVGPDEQVAKILALRYKELQCILQPGNGVVKPLPVSGSKQRLYSIELANCGK
jgi:hypothetical protein